VPLGGGPSTSEYDIDVDRPFAISPRPVTRGQFATVMRLPRPATMDIGRQVVEVTSREAREFCRLLGELEGREVRVPTYADLAYAAAAGTRYVEEATFDSIDPAASNAWGIYGLRGNLAEWCVSSRGSSAPGSATAPSDTGLELFHSPYTLRTDQDHQALPSSERHAFRVILPERR
jgi:formylglycine-generating enzyme required for sulfatase activity